MSSVLFEISKGGVRVVDHEKEGAGRESAAILLALTFTIPLNAVITISILRSFLRSYMFNILLCAVSVAALLDAAVNLTFASVFRASWTDLYFSLGDSLRWMCRFNAASTQLTIILQVFFLVLLSAHRLTSLPSGNHQASPKKSTEIKRYGWLLVLSYVAAISIVLPVSLGTVHVRYFQERYSCSPVKVPDNTASLATALSLLVFGICLPYALLAIIWTLLITRILRERQRLLNMEMVALQRAAARSSPVRGMGSSFNFSFPTWNLFWGEGDSAAGHGSKFFLLIGLLLSLQLLLVFPGLAYSTSTQFILPTQPFHHHHYNFGHAMLPSDYVPMYTPWFDDTFTWMRILHNILVPCLIIGFHQNLRTQVCELFGMCRHNNYTQLNPLPTISGIVSKRKFSKISQSSDEKTPILFATCDGLYLRQSVDSSMPYFVTHFSDLSLKQSGESVKKMALSPEEARRRKLQELNVLDEEDLVVRNKKNGKSVRFSQNVSEIPGDDYLTDANRIEVEEKKEGIREVLEKKTDVKRLKDFVGRAERRSSDPSLLKRSTRTLEMELADSSFGSSLSGSLLLPLSQRMRPRDL